MQQPIEVTPVDIAFGGKAMQILPAYRDIPEEFKSSGNKWEKFIQKWFFDGLAVKDYPTARDGINLRQALMNIQACLSCFEPKHEHKIAGAAYLASQWFE